MATEENYQENQESENNDPEAAEQKPSRRSQREGMTHTVRVLLISAI